jgi:2-methylisocitrate lyase-like PEP mutase family enzyme
MAIFCKAGPKVAIYPTPALFAAYRAVKALLQELQDTGTTGSFRDLLPLRQEFEELIGAAEGSRLAGRYKVI